LKIKKYGAIDIGSNAVRLLISNVILSKNNEPKYRKISLIRVPIRLGKDVFTKGYISDQNKARMTNAMKAFDLLMKIHQVDNYRAFATSAMRESNNGKKIVNEIKDKTNINIEIIDGKKEAEIIASTDLKELIDSDKSYLYVDVGGGSTEFTFFSEGKIIDSRSYKIGTVRMLNNSDKENKKIFKEVEKWIKKTSKNLSKIALIGSGGNINSIFKRSNTQYGKPLSYIYMNANYKFLKSMSYEDRITELGLKPDRADVIIPATKIYLSAMKWSGANKIYVPKIGLADGIIRSLHVGIL
jgi:exopolyphosphatase/guanosine-5'-triphosphate,3'-diphosphate pyrophosphatase